VTVEIRSLTGSLLLTVQRAYLRGAARRRLATRIPARDLRGADLATRIPARRTQGADLHLRGADLRGAYLRGADLQGAYLRGADLRGAKNVDLVIARTRILPDSGEISVWKKAAAQKIVQLRIPADAKRSHAGGRKCRAERAEVVAIFDSAGNPVDDAVSTWDSGFVYRVGATVEPTKPFDTDMWNECSSGIHFYITRLEAEAHD
jgi:hypothetical protein